MSDLIDFTKDWGEIFGLVTLILGFILATTTGSAGITYVVALITGVMFGMRWFSVHRGPVLHWYILILGFLIGYTLGSLFYASGKIVLALFVAGLVVGYFLKKSITPAKKK